MLVLTRKPQEVIHIGSDVTITVVRISKNSVRIGIDAPKNLSVSRGELPAKDRTETPPRPWFDLRHPNRLLRTGSVLSRVKSVTIVESPDAAADSLLARRADLVPWVHARQPKQRSGTPSARQRKQP